MAAFRAVGKGRPTRSESLMTRLVFFSAIVDATNDAKNEFFLFFSIELTSPKTSWPTVRRKRTTKLRLAPLTNALTDGRRHSPRPKRARAMATTDESKIKDVVAFDVLRRYAAEVAVVVVVGSGRNESVRRSFAFASLRLALLHLLTYERTNANVCESRRWYQTCLDLL